MFVVSRVRRRVRMRAPPARSERCCEDARRWISSRHRAAHGPCRMHGRRGRQSIDVASHARIIDGVHARVGPTIGTRTRTVKNLHRSRSHHHFASRDAMSPTSIDEIMLNNRACTRLVTSRRAFVTAASRTVPHRCASPVSTFDHGVSTVRHAATSFVTRQRRSSRPQLRGTITAAATAIAIPRAASKPRTRPSTDAAVRAPRRCSATHDRACGQARSYAVVHPDARRAPRVATSIAANHIGNHHARASSRVVGPPAGVNPVPPCRTDGRGSNPQRCSSGEAWVPGRAPAARAAAWCPAARTTESARPIPDCRRSPPLASGLSRHGPDGTLP